MSKVNVNTLKEIKDLKESENRQNRSKDMENQQDRNALCPPFLKQPTTTPPSPRLTAINPLILVFDGAANTQCQKTLHISNVSNERVAWRVLCNAPTRYVVTPNKGFLFRQEKIAVQVLLLNSSKYHRRHAFVVQVKPAKIEESNRKLTWKDLTANEMKVIQSTRVSTLSPSDEVRTAKVSSSGSNTSQVSDGSSVHACSSSSNSTASEPSLVASEKDHGEYTARIVELTELVKQAAEQKQINTQRMVAAVNEVKMLEVELDRAGQNLNQIQQKYNEREATIAEMRIRLKKVREQLLIAREADRRRNL